MGLTSGMRATILAGAAVLLSGLTLSIHAIAVNSTPRSLGGACLTLIALTVISLVVLRSWIVDTSNDRRALNEATAKAQDEYTRYLALQTALEGEQTRLQKDVNAERAALIESLAVERRQMIADFEEHRAELIAETTEAAFLMFHSGKFAPQHQDRGTIIRFPMQEPERQRAREHGVVGP